MTGKTVDIALACAENRDLDICPSLRPAFFLFSDSDYPLVVCVVLVPFIFGFRRVPGEKCCFVLSELRVVAGHRTVYKTKVREERMRDTVKLKLSKRRRLAVDVGEAMGWEVGIVGR